MENSPIVHNDQGFVLVFCLLILLILSIGGVMAIQTSTTEVQIAGNERSIKNNLYQAEATTYEGSQCIDNESSIDDLWRMGEWLESGLDGRNLTDAQQAVMDLLEEGDEAQWLLEIGGMAMNQTCFSTASGIDDGSNTISKKGYRLGIADSKNSGSSLKMTMGSSMYKFKFIGISSQNVGEKTVEIGFRKRLNR